MRSFFFACLVLSFTSPLLLPQSSAPVMSTPGAATIFWAECNPFCSHVGGTAFRVRRVATIAGSRTLDTTGMGGTIGAAKYL